MTLTEPVAKKIIKKLLRGEDYRIEVVTLINAEFLQCAIDFFKQIVDAKLANQAIDVDWYKEAFLLDADLSSSEIATNSGLNMKTISNMFNSNKKEVVIDAASGHYETLYNSIKELVENENEINLTLTIKLKSVAVDLNINESLIVINALAVKRAALRGGFWSTAGKRVEKPLMQTLCKLYQVHEENYAIKSMSNTSNESFAREIDFYLLRDKETEYKCEVKLMGKGNPESADAVIARDSRVFVADKLSDMNKAQLDNLNIEWVELRSGLGFRRFKKVLENLDIPHSNYNDDNLDEDMTKIFNEIFIFSGISD